MLWNTLDDYIISAPNFQIFNERLLHVSCSVFTRQARLIEYKVITLNAKLPIQTCD